MKSLGAILGTVLCLAVAIYATRYLLNIGTPPDIIAANSYLSPWLPIHVAGAALALLTGPPQFTRSLRAKRPSLHRWTGRVYVAACTIGGIAGLLLAIGSAAGPVATAGFGLLAIAWIATTLLAWRTAVQRRFVDHRAWMIRSLALSFAAVTLRLYLPVLLALPFSFANGYRAISFLCWVPNVFVSEYYLRRSPALNHCCKMGTYSSPFRGHRLEKSTRSATRKRSLSPVIALPASSCRWASNPASGGLQKDGPR